MTDYHYREKKDKEPGKKEMDALALAWEKQRNGHTFVGKNFSVEDIFNS